MQHKPTAAEGFYRTNPLDRLPAAGADRGWPTTDTFAEERREVLDGIVENLRWGNGDPAARTACRLLLRHLTFTSAPTEVRM